MNRTALKAQLRLHEGVRLTPYTCTAGKLTIGVGRNLIDVGISAREAEYLLDSDIDRTLTALVDALPWVLGLSDVRMRVLIDMAFNLGMQGLLGFKRTLHAVQTRDYEGAARGMLDSKWAGQVGERAVTLARMMATGEDYKND